MSAAMLVSKLLAIFFCTWCLVQALIKIYRGNRTIQYLAYCLVYFFFVLPLAIQIVFPFEYISFYKANDALKDVFSVTIYCFFIVALSYFMVLARFRHKAKVNDTIEYNPLLNKISVGFIVFTLFYTLITNGIGILFAGYGARLENEMYVINEPLISCSMLLYLVLLGQIKHIPKRYLILSTIALLPLLWIHGKRFIVAQLVIMALFVVFICGCFKGPTLFKLLAVGALGIIGFSYLYGVLFKNNISSVLEYVSIDFSRHYTLIYQIYCSTINRSISIHPFDSVLFNILFWVPRSLWPSKPYPFSNSLTRSLLGLEVGNINLGWSTTTSIFCDLFDSFSYFGFIFGIAIVYFVCKFINKTKKVHYKVLGVYFLVTLLTVQLSAALTTIVISLFIFLLSDILSGKKNRKRYPSQIQRKGLGVHVIIKRR